MTNALAYKFPVELQQAHTPSGKKIPNKFAIVRTDKDEVLSVVTDKYQLITHSQVMDQVDELIENLRVAKGPNGKIEKKCYLDRNGATMNFVTTFKDIGADLKVGDHVGMRVVVRNSYTGGSAAIIRIGGVVLSCTNGMVSEDKNSKSSLRLTHIAANKDKLDVPHADELLRNFFAASKVWDKYSSIKLGMDRLGPLVDSVTSSNALTLKAAQKILFQEPKTAWDAMQLMTSHVTHERPKLSEDSRITALANINSTFEVNFNG